MRDDLVAEMRALEAKGVWVRPGGGTLALPDQNQLPSGAEIGLYQPTTHWPWSDPRSDPLPLIRTPLWAPRLELAQNES
jgi:hypothetical protein